MHDPISVFHPNILLDVPPGPLANLQPITAMVLSGHA